MKYTLSHTFSIIGLAILLLLGGLACKNDKNTEVKASPKTKAFGSPGRVNIVADEDIITSEIADSLTYIFEAAFPILPRPESTFTLNFFSMEDFNANPERKYLRNLVFVADIEDPSSGTANYIRRILDKTEIEKDLDNPSDISVKLQSDRWADGQLVFLLYGKGKDNLQEIISKNYDKMANKIQEADSPIYASKAFKEGVSKDISSLVKKQFDINIDIPYEYSVAIQDTTNNALWLRRAGKVFDKNLIFLEIPSTPETPFTTELLYASQNTFFKRYVSATQEGSYAEIADEVLRVYYKMTKINKATALESRGLWEMIGAPMGGPFLSYLIEDQANQRHILVGTFVRGPSKPKKEVMLEMEAILRTFQLQKQED